MEHKNNELSRRSFIGKASKIGGASAVLGMSGAMGLFMEDVEAKQIDKQKHQKAQRKTIHICY
ncbi:hypothetical protein AAAC51_33770 [Priestia megaterium]